MIAHISWIGMFDYIALGLFVLVGLLAAVTLWLEDEEQDEAELIDIVERLPRNEGHL